MSPRTSFIFASSMKLNCNLNRSGRQTAVVPEELPYHPAGQEIMVNNVAPYLPYEVYVLRGSIEYTFPVQDPTTFVGPREMDYPSYVLVCSPDETNPSVIKRVLYVCLLTGVSLSTCKGDGDDWWRTIATMQLVMPGQDVHPARMSFTDDPLWNLLVKDQDLINSELLFRPAYDVNLPGMYDTSIRNPLTKAEWNVNSDTSELIHKYYNSKGVPFLTRTYPYSRIEGASLTMTYQNYNHDLFALGTVSIGNPSRTVVAAFGDLVGICPLPAGGYDTVWVGMYKPAGSDSVKGVLHRSSDPGSHVEKIEGNPAMIYAGPLSETM